MKTQVTCSIIQDLLPNYIEKLTSDESNVVIEEHLNSCGSCREIYEQMIADIGSLDKAPLVELSFLKKIKRTRLLAAVLSIVLTLVFSYLIYTSEYKFANDKAELSNAITEFTSESRHPIDAYVLETKEKDGVLFVSFKDQVKSNVNGVAVLYKGVNQKYRIIKAHIDSSKYSSIIQIHRITIKDQRYYIISGYNLSQDIKHYGLDYNGYTNPGYFAKDRIKEIIKFDVKNQQFMEIYKAEELDSILEDSVEYTLYNPFLWEASMYDAEGIEITDNFINQQNINEDVSYGIGKAELFILYIFIVIVLVLGGIFTRYFLTE